jgi:outer membrane murein-binding lipoprotein Lpp
MDIDAIGKEIPRFKRIADQMERILANPFVVGTEAERADALADLQALREFRDRLPDVDRKLDALDSMIQDVSELKNRPTFDPSMIPQPSDNPGVTEDGVKRLIQEALSSTALGGDPSTNQTDLAAQVSQINDRLNTLATHVEGLPAAGSAPSDLTDVLKARDEEIAGLKTTVTAQDTKIGELSGTVDSLSTKLDALMDALDVKEPDLGEAGAGDNATEADVTKETPKDPAAPAAPQGVQDPA